MADVEAKRICQGSNYERTVENIQDLMANILSRLPVKHLLKCKTVGKMCKNLISEHYFAKLHFSNSRTNPKFIAYIHKDAKDAPHRGTKLYLIEESGRCMPFVRFPAYLDDGFAIFDLECSFNGLICCTVIAVREWGVWICNPFTNEIHVLPKGSPLPGFLFVSVVFNSETHKYKVLRFFRDSMGSENNYKCEIYSPGAEAWTRIANVPVDSQFSSQVNVGGRVYWLVMSKEDKLVPTYILTVDIEGDFTRVELPSYEADHPFGRRLAEFENRLLLIGVDDSGENFLIWSLQDHHKPTWSPVEKVSHGLPGMRLKHIGSIVSMKNELLFLVKTVDAQLYRYRVLNLEKRAWRELQVSTELRKDQVVFPFTESVFKCNLAD